MRKELFSVKRAIWFGAFAFILIAFFVPSLQAQTAADESTVTANVTSTSTNVGASSGNAADETTATANVTSTSTNADASSGTSHESKPWLEVYGFAMTDMIGDFKTNNPDWFDTARATKLPSFKGEFGEDGHFYGSVRQSRFGVKSSYPTPLGDLTTRFEFDMFGVGADQGQTTIRLRYAYGELGQFGAGQTTSPFMDLDVFPNSLEYWGPTGMVFFRNVQFRWTPMTGENEVILALERPGASGDAGAFADRIEIQNIQGRFPLPDFSGHYRRNGDWGHIQVAGILRKIKWDDTLADAFDLSGSATGWGLDFSSNVKFGDDTLHLEYVYGRGIENYMNDSPVDIGIELQPGNVVTPITGKPLPINGVTAFLDHVWSEKFSSAVGYSYQNIDNTIASLPNAFKQGQYALGNLLYYPAKNVMIGGEFQWVHRENFTDGFKSDDERIQVSFKYNFSATIGGQ